MIPQRTAMIELESEKKEHGERFLRHFGCLPVDGFDRPRTPNVGKKICRCATDSVGFRPPAVYEARHTAPHSFEGFWQSMATVLGLFTSCPSEELERLLEESKQLTAGAALSGDEKRSDESRHCRITVVGDYLGTMMDLDKALLPETAILSCYSDLDEAEKVDPSRNGRPFDC